MSDERKSSPEADKLTIDIQQAVGAYSEFQTKLSHAIKPWQDQCASVKTAIQPLHDLLGLVVERHRQWTEDLQDAQVAWQERINQWCSNWEAVQAGLAKKIAEAGPWLRRTLERADHVGRLGWTVTMSMGPTDMVRLSTMELSSEADAYMLGWYESHDADLARSEKRILEMKELESFRTPLSQCFSAYRRGDYALTIPLLVAVLERGIRSLGPTDRFFSTKVEKTVKDLYDKAKEDDPAAIEVFVWMSLYAFVQWFYEQYGTTNAGESRPFRHGIQHGTQPPPNEKVEVLRLLHALQTVAALYGD